MINKEIEKITETYILADLLSLFINMARDALECGKFENTLEVIFTEERRVLSEIKRTLENILDSNDSLDTIVEWLNYAFCLSCALEKHIRGDKFDAYCTSSRMEESVGRGRSCMYFINLSLFTANRISIIMWGENI